MVFVSFSLCISGHANQICLLDKRSWQLWGLQEMPLHLSGPVLASICKQVCKHTSVHSHWQGAHWRKFWLGCHNGPFQVRAALYLRSTLPDRKPSRWDTLQDGSRSEMENYPILLWPLFCCSPFSFLISSLLKIYWNQVQFFFFCPV